METDMQEIGALVMNDAIAAAAGTTCALSYINTIVTLLWGQLLVARLWGMGTRRNAEAHIHATFPTALGDARLDIK